jgi:ribosome maturation factor RimP
MGLFSQEMGLVETFERAVLGVPLEPEFADVEIVASSSRRQGRTTALSLVVDRPSGVDVALCERLAARLNAALDAETDPYTLEIESPGLDRPLTRAGDYERFRDSAARVVTTLAIGGAKTHRGTLLGVRDTNVILLTPKGELPLPLALIKSANLEYDIRSDLRREKQKKRENRTP